MNAFLELIYGFLLWFDIGRPSDLQLWYLVVCIVIFYIPFLNTFSIFLISFFLGTAIFASYQQYPQVIISGLIEINPVDVNLEWIGLPIFIVPILAFIGYLITNPSPKPYKTI